jgi:catechol 2,3-dioxygenase
MNEMAGKTSIGATGYFSPRRIGHVNLYISEYEPSLRFYREVIGLCDGWTRPAIGGGFLNNGATHHDIGFIPWNSSITRKKADGPGLNHLAFELEDEADLVRGYERAKAEGTTFQTTDHLVAWSIYSFDPHGYGIEIYADTGLSFDDAEFLKLKRASVPWSPGAQPPSADKRYVKDHRPRRDDKALFHATKLTGAVLVSDAFEAARDYYMQTVGLHPVVTGRDFVCLGGSLAGRDVSIFRAKPGAPALFHHMHFSVFDEADLERSIAAAGSFGVVVEREIDHPRRRGAVVKSPDGARVLLYVERAPDTAGLAALAPEEAIWLV